MATDATGAPTSPDSIPTYNTNADAPSGLGFNAAMAALQTALVARISKPAGLVSGEAAIYNGATFDRSSVTKLTANGVTGLFGLSGLSGTISATNTDLAWAGGFNLENTSYISTGGGTLRSIGVPSAGNGTRLTLRNGVATNVTLKHNLAGGSGAVLFLATALDTILGQNDVIEFVYDGANWLETSRNINTWQTYTPTWGSSGTQPALGNGTIAGRYMLIGRTLFARVQLVVGSTSTFGTGNYTLTLPLTTTGSLGGTGTAFAFDSSAASYYYGNARWASATVMNLFNNAIPAIQFTATVPFTWAVNDVLELNVMLEV